MSHRGLTSVTKIIAALLFSHLEVIFKDDSGLLLFSQWSPTILIYSRLKEQFLSFKAMSLGNIKYCRGRIWSESTWVWTPAKELCGLGMVTYPLWASASPALNWGIRVPSSQGVCAVQNSPLCSGKQALAIGIYSCLLSSSSPFSQCGF